jgi:hypothetical protein
MFVTIGSRLTRPATWILLTGVKLIDKLAPGQRGQVCSMLYLCAHLLFPSQLIIVG